MSRNWPVPMMAPSSPLVLLQRGSKPKAKPNKEEKKRAGKSEEEI